MLYSEINQHWSKYLLFCHIIEISYIPKLTIIFSLNLSLELNKMLHKIPSIQISEHIEKRDLIVQTNFLSSLSALELEI